MNSVNEAATTKEIQQMDPDERMAYWKKQLSKCIKCYGCRDACPVCICKECELEDGKWVERGAIPPNELFHIIRAYHLVGLCIHCGECEKACPMEIPLRKIHDMMRLLSPDELFDLMPFLDDKTKQRLVKSLEAKPIVGREVKK
jgi:ferredoxin